MKIDLKKKHEEIKAEVKKGIDKLTTSFQLIHKRAGESSVELYHKIRNGIREYGSRPKYHHYGVFFDVQTPLTTLEVHKLLQEKLYPLVDINVKNIEVREMGKHYEDIQEAK